MALKKRTTGTRRTKSVGRSTRPKAGKKGKVLFFPVPLFKLFVMYTVTLGIYGFYWFYKNWELVRTRTGRDISPVWRAIFSLVTFYYMMLEIEKEAIRRKVPIPVPLPVMIFPWIFLAFSIKLPAPYLLVSYLSPLPLVIAQGVANRLNGIVAPGHDRNSSYSGWSIFWIVLGGLLQLLAILSVFLPIE